MRNPRTPTMRPIGSTMPQMLRGGGTGAAIGASTAILPPPVSGGGSCCGGTNGRVVTRNPLASASVALPAGLVGYPVGFGEETVDLLLEREVGEPAWDGIVDQQAEQ